MNIKERMKRGEKVYGAHVNLTDPVITEIIASLGYDFIWVDMEHTSLHADHVYHHILAAHAHNTPVFVRVPQNDLTHTKKVLEMNVDGIIFPMAESAAHAASLIADTLYPPYGKRGCGPKGAVNYGLESEMEYYGQGHIDKLCRFVQIESKQAANEAEEFAKIPYLDGVFIGMHDMSGSLGKLGQVFDEENVSLALRSIEAMKKNGLVSGIPTFATDEKTLKRYNDMGFTVFAVGADYEYIVKGARNTLKTLNSL